MWRCRLGYLRFDIIFCYYDELIVFAKRFWVYASCGEGFFFDILLGLMSIICRASVAFSFLIVFNVLEDMSL